MKKVLLSVAAFGAMTSVALADSPTKLTDTQLDQIAAGDSGKVGQGDKKVGAQSTRPKDGSGAYDIGTKDFKGPNH